MIGETSAIACGAFRCSAVAGHVCADVSHRRHG
jgi:hypothetical protein